MRLMLLLLLCCATLSAQEARYLSGRELRAEFDKLALENPRTVRIENLPGNAPGLYSVTLGETGGSKAALLVLGSLRADEFAPALQCLQLARDMTADGRKEDFKGYPFGRVIIVPTPGGEAVAGAPGLPYPLDDDRDQAIDEDGPEDLNGDGVISQMRVRREGGRYRVSTLDARILIECKPGEVGEFDVLWEGIDNDGDGEINEDPRGTVTLSNDFAIRWSDKQKGANRFPMVTPQSRALADFLLAHPEICAAVQLRSIGGRLILAGGPPSGQQPQGRGRRAETPPAEDPAARDKQMYESWQKLFEEINGPKTPADLEPFESDGAGNVLDWLYEACGVYAATWHLFRLPDDKPPKKEGEGELKDAKAYKPTREERDEQAWLKYTPEDYLEWKVLKHATLGEVEVGGWKNTARRDPKPADASAMAARVKAFAAVLVTRLPGIEVANMEKKDLGEGLTRIRVTLGNSHEMDYKPAFAAANRIGLPLFVGLAEDKAVELVSGARRQSVENINGGATVAFEWVVRIKDPAAKLKFKVESRRTGDLERERTLKECEEWKE